MQQDTTVIRREDIPAIQEAARKAVGGTPALPPEPTKPEQKSDIPEGFPEKFIKDGKPDYAALAKSYAELEKSKVGTKPAETPKPDEGEKKEGEQKPAEAVATDSVIPETDLKNYTDEFEKNGDLSEETVKAIVEKHKLPRALVDNYVAGLKAQRGAAVAEFESKLVGTVGGRENYDAMAAWARENLDESERQAFDAVVTSGNEGQAAFAIQGLYARFTAAEGQAPSRTIHGASRGPSVAPFRSMQEAVAAVKDPRYAKDPAYRADVQARYAASGNYR